MKNSIFYFGIILVSLVTMCNASNTINKQNYFYHSVIWANSNISNFEEIEAVISTKIEKTAEELIAEDNAITENNISNETQALDFNCINSFSIIDEEVSCTHTSKIKKTAEELIAEDNAITENNISNETQALDFNCINSHLIVDEEVESTHTCKNEKTAEELFAEDNAITENNISNEFIVLDFKVINRDLNFNN